MNPLNQWFLLSLYSLFSHLLYCFTVLMSLFVLSSGKTFLRAPQMNINIATWGRLVRRAIPTVSSNSFSPQVPETGQSSLPGSPTPSRWSHMDQIRMSCRHESRNKDKLKILLSSALLYSHIFVQTQWPSGDQAGLWQRAHTRTKTLPKTWRC